MKHIVMNIAAILLAPLAALHAADAPKFGPNVIVILADDLGWADLSCYGSTFHESPNLDKLAAQQPERAKDLRARLDAWRNETAANMPRTKQ